MSDVVTRLKRRIFEWYARVRARFEAFRVKIFARLCRFKDDIKYKFTSQYYPVRHAARLAYEATELGEVGDFVRTFSNGDPEKIIEFYIYGMIEQSEVYGQEIPSSRWKRVYLGGHLGVVPRTNNAVQQYTPPVYIYNMRVSTRAFSAYLNKLKTMDNGRWATLL